MMVNPIARLMAAGALGAVLANPLHAETWDQAHGDSMNAGYANVNTAPATGNPLRLENRGTFAPGTGFAIAPDGTVFVGNDQGQVFGFNADATAMPFAQTLEPGESIAGAPVIGANDDLFVVAVKGRGTRHPESSLARFTIGGTPKERTLFPMHGGSSGEALGAPVVYRTGGGANALVAVVVSYPNQASAGYETRLVTFVNGTLFLDQRIDVLVPSTEQAADVVATNPPKPQPGVAIFTQGSNQPYFLVSDGFQSLSGFRFTSAGLVEDFHLRDDSRFHSIIGAPMIAPDGLYYVGTTGGLMIGRPGNQLPLWTTKEMKTTAPATSLRKPGSIGIAGGKAFNIYKGINMTASSPNSGTTTSIASSYTHFYVSTTDKFLTYDGANHLPVARFDWVRGGQNPPAIGPKGHVYAIANNTIFIFPPPKATPFDNVSVYQPGLPTGTVSEVDGSGNATATSNAPLVMQPALPITPMQPVQPTSQPPAQSQRFQPPTTTNGNRLFACEKLDGDDCGKGDHKAISLAFCQTRGFAKVEGYDVDSRKGTAETLSGEFCSKNKCKVFDTIDCGQ